MEYKRLTDYEENGTVSISCELSDVIDRLAELEDKIENGTLIELPCKFGDKFYLVYFDEIVEKEFYEIDITKDEISVSDGCGCLYPVGEYGDMVRFTREEAEKRQKELYGE